MTDNDLIQKNQDDFIRRGDAVAMLLAMRGPVDAPRTEKAVWVDEGIDRCIEELRDMPAAMEKGDYFEGIEEGIQIGREAALREAAALCDRYPYVEGVKQAILDMIQKGADHE